MDTNIKKPTSPFGWQIAIVVQGAGDMPGLNIRAKILDALLEIFGYKISIRFIDSNAING